MTETNKNEESSNVEAAETNETVAKTNDSETKAEVVEEKTEETKTEEVKVEAVEEKKVEPKKKAHEIAEESDEEVWVKLEDLEEESEYSLEQMTEMEGLYDRTFSQINEEEVVAGEIVTIGNKDVIIDIGFKTEGSISVEEFDNLEELKVGDSVKVYIQTMEDRHGNMILSRRKAEFMERWSELVAKAESEEIITGVCTRRIKGGIVVDLRGVDAFLPGSQIDVKPVRDFDALIGKEMEFKIAKVNEARKNIVVSHRALIEESLKGKRVETLEKIEKGVTLKGTVKNITDFGAFIDLGGVDGLLHITDLSWGRISHPSEVVSLDEELDVMITDYDEEKTRISLSLKLLKPQPWENMETRYNVNDIVKGKVVSITDYGAFVELEKGIEGLIHISEMSWSQHIKHPSKLLTVGEQVEAVILSIEPEVRKISLGLKQIEPDPWESLEDRFPIGSTHKGIVRNLTNFGAFVELEEGIDGLVHISDLSWTKKVRHPGEIVSKGQEIEVVVLSINREERRIALGHKQIDENPWDSFESQLAEGTSVKGAIIRMIDKGVIVEVLDGVEGFVPNSHLENDRNVQEGDILDLAVIEFSKDEKKIVFSQTEHLKKEESKLVDEYNEKESAKAEETVEEVTETVVEEVVEKAKEETETVVEAVEEVVETVKEKVEDVVETVKDVVEEVKEAVEDIKAEVEEVAEPVAEEKTEEAPAETKEETSSEEKPKKEKK
ncbi:MAG: 30S ribosomal protein S1 [Calditrichaeota bacterium]|nr:MAG: 30S ribosomal protein S1 [Calditrichota bacterium]